MKVTVFSRSDEQLDQNDYQDCLEIKVNGKRRFRVHDGELEDGNLARDFNDCFKITELMKEAFDSGKNGENIEFEHLDLEEN